MSHVLERLVRCFDKQTEELAKELPLRGTTLQQLQEIFSVPVDDPMYDCFPIERRHVQKLEPFLSEHIDLEHCHCFVECDATEVLAQDVKGAAS
jgi:hypothetical protein